MMRFVEFDLVHCFLRTFEPRFRSLLKRSGLSVKEKLGAAVSCH